MNPKASLLIAPLALVALYGAPAGAQASSCETTKAHIQTTKAWQSAGRPQVVCHVDLAAQTGAAGVAGLTVTNADGAQVVEVSDNYSGMPDADFYDTVITHEVGHAYADFHVVNYTKYARVRGFARGTDVGTISEDYAETFAFSLGMWHDHGAGAPYDFHTSAGVPTPSQLRSLRAAHLLP